MFLEAFEYQKNVKENVIVETKGSQIIPYFFREISAL